MCMALPLLRFLIKKGQQVPSPHWGFETPEGCSGSNHLEHSSPSRGKEGWLALYNAGFLYFLRQPCKEMFCETIHSLQKDVRILLLSSLFQTTKKPSLSTVGHQNPLSGCCLPICFSILFSIPTPIQFWSVLDLLSNLGHAILYQKVKGHARFFYEKGKIKASIFSF